MTSQELSFANLVKAEVERLGYAGLLQQHGANSDVGVKLVLAATESAVKKFDSFVCAYLTKQDLRCDFQKLTLALID